MSLAQIDRLMEELTFKVNIVFLYCIKIDTGFGPPERLLSTLAGQGEGAGGAHPPLPRDDLRFSNTTSILQKVVYWC